MLDSLALTLSDLAQTKRFANCLSQFIAPGRVFCLSGPLGAGKSELARAMITTFCGPQDDIPSPTFTLFSPTCLMLALRSGIWISIASKPQNKPSLSG